jgi:hypothetical protein
MRAILITGIVTLLAVGPLLSPAGADGGPVPIALDGCQYVEALVKVQPETVEPLVPADFVVRKAADGTATVNMGVATCAHAVSGGDEGPAAFGWLLVRILAPADPVLAGGLDVTVHFYRLEHYTLPDDVYARVAQGAGADRIVVDTLDAHVDHALSSLTVAGAGLAHTAVLPASPIVDLGPPGVFTRWREFHAVEGGYATLEASLVPDGTAETVAHVIAPSGGLAEQVIGPANAGLAYYGAAFGVADAWMAVLPVP